MLGPNLIEGSYARVFRHGTTDDRGPYVMLVMGNDGGTRNVYLARSPDGRDWDVRRQPFIRPPYGTSQMGTGSLFEWQGRHYVVCFANREDSPEYEPISDLHLYEVSSDLDHATQLGMFMPHDAAGAGNARINDPCLVQTQERLYLFINVGRRLQQRIALAVADAS